MASVTIQPSTADAFVSAYSTDLDTNYGANTGLTVKHYTNRMSTAPVLFDFHTAVPAGATITAATLSLYCYSYSARTITVYRLLRTDWVESQATGRIYKTGSNWGTAGALNATTDFTTTDAATAASAAGWVSWDVKNQVQTARDSVGGLAHFLLADMQIYDANPNIFYSREYATNASLCPKLYIEYTVPFTGPKVNIGGTWKSPVSMMVNIGGTWKSVVSVKVNIGGAWKDLA